MLKKQLGLFLLSVTAVFLAASPAHAVPTFLPTYNVINIGILPGYVSSTATSVDSAGEVVGYDTDNSGNTQAFYWTHAGGLVGLGGTNSKAFGVNDGNVVGATSPAISPTATQAFRWTASTGIVVLDPSNQGQANGVSPTGEIIGDRTASPSVHRIVSFSPTNTLANPFPSTNLTGEAINSLGQYVGDFNSSAGYYNDGVSNARISLGNLLPTSLSDNRIATGSVLQIASFENINTTSTTTIGTLAGDVTSKALGINPLGTDIVGVSGTSGFYYDIAGAGLLSLSSLLAPAFSGWSIQSGNAITDSGFVAGQGTFGGQQIAVLLVQVPEPSSIFLFVSALLGVVAHSTWR